MGSAEREKIGIVGGGILGLTLAVHLSDRGFRVTVIEAEDRVGGILIPIEIGNYLWDRFYHVILNSDESLLGFLERLELHRAIEWGPAKTGFYTDGAFYSMSNILEFLRFPPLSFIDLLRLGGTIFMTSRIKSWQKLENVPVEQWLRRLSGHRNFRKIWLPLLKSKLGENYRITNAAFIWSTIARMYSARRSGAKQEMFGYIRGGYATVLDHLRTLLERQSVEVICGKAVVQVRKRDRDMQIELSGGDRLSADAIVMTNDCGAIAALCPELTEAERARLRQVQYEHVVCPVFLLKKPLGGYYITNITEDGFPFTTAIEMTALVDKITFDGNSLVYLPRYLADDDPCLQWDDAALCGTFFSSLRRMYPGLREEDIAASTVARARCVFPVTTINYSKDVMPGTRTSVKGLFIANSSQIPNGTMNVNELVALSHRKARELTEYIYEK